MAYSNRGLRGGTFEEVINLSNEQYRQQGLALIQKIPTPIVPVNIDKESRTITLAYFEQKSTVDYIGVVQGIPACFDAKETRQKHLPISNIHQHQMEFMAQFIKQKGVAFIIVNFALYEECYLLPFELLKSYWDAAQKGGRKSIPYDAFKQGYRIDRRGGYIHYLEALDKYLSYIDKIE